MDTEPAGPLETPEDGEQRPPDKAKLKEVWTQFYAYCFTIVNQCRGVRQLSSFDREDCIQEVMVAIVSKFGGQSELPKEDVSNWIRSLSRNKAADILREKYRKPMHSFDDGAGAAVRQIAEPSDEEERARQGEYVSLVWEALLSLDNKVPVTSYLVFYLRTIEFWEYNDIAELFQVSVKVARERCHRVRKQFLEQLEARGITEWKTSPGSEPKQAKKAKKRKDGEENP